MGFCRQGILVFAALTALSAPAAFAGSDAAPSFDCAKASLAGRKGDLRRSRSCAAIDRADRRGVQADFEPAYDGDKKALARRVGSPTGKQVRRRPRLHRSRADSSALETSRHVRRRGSRSYAEGLIGQKALDVRRRPRRKAVEQPMPENARPTAR